MKRPSIVKCNTREETINQIASLSERSPINNVYLDGPTILSDIPEDLREGGGNGAIIGIDEAGRGPLLGPMVYCAAFWATLQHSAMEQKGFDDSKALTGEARSTLFTKILRETPELGVCVRVLHASEISRNMFRAGGPYNLNEMSHDAAIHMICSIRAAGVAIERVYVDTVGNEKAYQTKLEQVFQGSGIQFVVEKKADSKYVSCSAASIVAKVIRDDLTSNWVWSETGYNPVRDDEKDCPLTYGSGYPSDQKCKLWLERSLTDPVFCFPDLVRFSWGPAKEAMKNLAIAASVEWEADDDDVTEGVHLQTKMSDFTTKDKPGPLKKKRRFQIFEELGLSIVRSIDDSSSF